MGGSSGAIVGPPGDQRPGSGEACSRDPRPSLCVVAEGPQSRCSPPPPPPPSLLAQPLFGSYLRNALSPLPRSCLGTRGARLSPVPRHCSTAAWSQPRWALTRAAARLLPHMPSMAITQPPHRSSSPTHALSSPVLHSAPSPASSNGNLSTVTPFPPSAPPATPAPISRVSQLHSSTPPKGKGSTRCHPPGIGGSGTGDPRAQHCPPRCRSAPRRLRPPAHAAASLHGTYVPAHFLAPARLGRQLAGTAMCHVAWGRGTRSTWPGGDGRRMERMRSLLQKWHLRAGVRVPRAHRWVPDHD